MNRFALLARPGEGPRPSPVPEAAWAAAVDAREDFELEPDGTARWTGHPSGVPVVFAPGPDGIRVERPDTDVADLLDELAADLEATPLYADGVAPDLTETRVPDLEALLEARADEDGNPLGYALREDRVDAALAGLDPDDLLECLEDPSDLSGAMSALQLVPALVAREPGLTRLVQAAVLDLVPSDQVLRLRGQGDDEDGFVLGLEAARTYLDTLWGPEEDPDAPPPANPVEARSRSMDLGSDVTVCLQQALRNPATPPCCEVVLEGFLELLDVEADPGPLAEAVAAALRSTVEDPARPPAQRVLAYEQLGEVVERLEGELRGDFETALAHATGVLRAAIDDPAEDAEVRDWARENLTGDAAPAT